MKKMNFTSRKLRNHLLKIAFKVPFSIIDKILLMFPFLYKSELIRYETGVGPKAIQLLIQSINETKDLPGNIIECGSNRCGTASILALYLKSKNIMKKIYALDSFSGFIQEEIQKERELGLTDFSEKSYHYNTYGYVKKKIF